MRGIEAAFKGMQRVKVGDGFGDCAAKLLIPEVPVNDFAVHSFFGFMVAGRVGQILSNRRSTDGG